METTQQALLVSASLLVGSLSVATGYCWRGKRRFVRLYTEAQDEIAQLRSELGKARRAAKCAEGLAEQRQRWLEQEQVRSAAYKRENEELKQQVQRWYALYWARIGRLIVWN